MRVLIVGNSGSGKSTVARALAAEHRLVHLDLDTLVWEPGKVALARPVDDAVADLLRFLNNTDRWVIEGCYGDFVEAALPYCREFVFMNPGKAVCIAHNQERPWEPHKYESKEKQDSMLSYLLDWVSQYYEREDTCSYAYHRRLFDTFNGNKREVT